MNRTVVIDVQPGAPPDYGPGHVVVAVDVIRSATTAITGLVAGRRCFPVPSIEAAVSLAAAMPDALLVGELGGAVPYGFDMDNSPSQLAGRDDVWRPFILLSTSGTRVMCEGATGRRVYVAGLRNTSAQATNLEAHHPSVALVAAATRGEFREEDQLCCARIAARLMEEGFEPLGTTGDVVDRWADAPVDAVRSSKSCRYLADVGRHDDLEFVLEHVDDVDDVFELRAAELVAVSRPQPADQPTIQPLAANIVDVPS